MPGDGFSEVFYFEGAFEAGGEEAAEGSDERGKACEYEDMELHGRDVDGVWVERGEERGEVVRVRFEDGIGGAGQASEDVGAEVLRMMLVCKHQICTSRGQIWRRTLTGQMK